jgi:hypothetical protein
MSVTDRQLLYRCRGPDYDDHSLHHGLGWSSSATISLFEEGESVAGMDMGVILGGGLAASMLRGLWVRQ